ncbi:sensor histidine kinase [Paenibacillus roseipurpureus]|uniref:Histidine kinase n=1 Tax=Paenibacillus roseopurpureus TaxID=2918901 RepID=A0AA96RM39_9BACL|nr:histidine kinase [Paenibacillus sp. MBLB1832]WNR46056.1 histidine kinase [Paenibacillus sp. MBLB1832]
MRIRLSIFQKINIILIILFVPTLILIYYSTRTSTEVVRNEILKSSETYLSLLANQIDTTADQLSFYAITMNRDSTLRSFLNYETLQAPYDKYTTRNTIVEKLKLNSTSSSWNNSITVFAPRIKEVVSSDDSITYNENYIRANLTPTWKLHAPDKRYGSDSYFIRHFTDPIYTAGKLPFYYQSITEITFSKRNLMEMLDTFRASGNIHDPILYMPDQPPILNSKSEAKNIEPLIASLDGIDLSSNGHITTQWNGNKYLITYKMSKTLGWYLTDYVPINTVLSPIKRISLIFTAILLFLIVVGFTLSFTIYRNVQAPIAKMMYSVRTLMRGDYSAQIDYQAKNEFHILITQFNAMARQIKEQIETIYESKIRLQEATLKQLQSQIDPHFLYNCLNFIQNSAKRGDEEMIISMTLNLGAYYRYTTRLGNPLSTLHEEITLIRNYLEIHKLRLRKMSYDIQIPKEMENIELPRLLLQPLVENAIIHGIEPNVHPGYVRITGEMKDGFYRLDVEDNGVGMKEEARLRLNKAMTNSGNEDDLCGVWNVAQRLLLHWGEQAEVAAIPSELGGLKISLSWPIL